MKSIKFTALMLVLMFCLSALLPICPQIAIPNIFAISRHEKHVDDNQHENEEYESEALLVDGSEFNDPLGRLRFNGMMFDAGVENHDYMHIVTRAELEIVRDWLVDLGFDIEDDKDVEWIKENNNKILEKAVDEDIIARFLPYKPGDLRKNSQNGTTSGPTRWWGTGHEKAYQNAVNLLTSDGKGSIAAFLNNLRVDFIDNNNDPQNETAYDALVTLVKAPDKFTIENSAGTHLYLIDYLVFQSGGYYSNSNLHYSRTARTKLEDHYSTALNSWAVGNKDNAIKYLGYAIHYLEDIGATPHTTWLPFGYVLNLGDVHAEFEEHANIYWDNFSNGASANGYYGCFSNNFGDSVNTLAEITGQLTYRNYFNETSEPIRMQNYDTILTDTIPLTEQHIAALLDQFYTDIQAIDGNVSPTHRSQNVIRDGYIYTLKNVSSGYYLDGVTCNSGTIVRQYASGTSSQKFVAHYHNDDASFSFAPVSNDNVRIGLHSDLFDLPPYHTELLTYSSSNKIQRFKPTYLSSGRYRIMNGKTDFAEVVAVNNNSGAAGESRSYGPANSTEYWYIEEVTEWLQPTFSSSSNPHGTVTASGPILPGEDGWRAFDGIIKNHDGSTYYQWTANASRAISNSN